MGPFYKVRSDSETLAREIGGEGCKHLQEDKKVMSPASGPASPLSSSITGDHRFKAHQPHSREPSGGVRALGTLPSWSVWDAGPDRVSRFNCVPDPQPKGTRTCKRPQVPGI